EKHPLQIVLHCRNSTPFHYCHVERSRGISDAFRDRVGDSSTSLGTTKRSLPEPRASSYCARRCAFQTRISPSRQQDKALTKSPTKSKRLYARAKLKTALLQFSRSTPVAA